jgi:hypothetical protein
MGQGFTLVYSFNFAWMDDSSLNHGNFARLKVPPASQSFTGLSDTAATGMIRQPNIEWPAQFALERYYFPATRAGSLIRQAAESNLGSVPSGERLFSSTRRIQRRFRLLNLAEYSPRKLSRIFISQASNGKTPVAISEEQLHSALAALGECRAALLDSGNRDTALLVSVAILDLRMKLNQIADSELKALCDAMLPDDAPAERSQDPKSQQGQRRGVLLRLVK